MPGGVLTQSFSTRSGNCVSSVSPIFRFSYEVPREDRLQCLRMSITSSLDSTMPNIWRGWQVEVGSLWQFSSLAGSSRRRNRLGAFLACFEYGWGPRPQDIQDAPMNGRTEGLLQLNGARAWTGGSASDSCSTMNTQQPTPQGSLGKRALQQGESEQRCGCDASISIQPEQVTVSTEDTS